MTEAEAIRAIRLAMIPKAWFETTAKMFESRIVDPSEDTVAITLDAWFEDLIERSSKDLQVYIDSIADPQDNFYNLGVVASWLDEKIQDMPDGPESLRAARACGQILNYVEERLK